MVRDYRPLLDSAPRFTDAMEAEGLYRISTMLNPEQTDVANKLRALVESLSPKGMAGVIEMDKKGLTALAGIDDEPLLEAFSLLAATQAQIYSKKLPSYHKYLLRNRIVRAAMAAQYVGFALRAEQRKSGKWPAKLESLGDLTKDPISGKPFEYDVGKAIRSPAIECGKPPNCDPKRLEPIVIEL